jgi:hypothetical protein
MKYRCNKCGCVVERSTAPWMGEWTCNRRRATKTLVVQDETVCEVRVCGGLFELQKEAQPPGAQAALAACEQERDAARRERDRVREERDEARALRARRKLARYFRQQVQ